jgi:flagellar motor switch protein FliN
MTGLENGAAAEEDDWAAALAEQRSAESGNNVAKAAFESFAPPGGATAARSTADLDQILEIPITLSVEIGKSRLTIRNLLQLNQGSVVELDRMAGEPLDVLINGTLVAHGEVVVINEKFGIRLTDVVSTHERVKKLR